MTTAEIKNEVAAINNEVQEYISNGGAKEDLFEDVSVILNTYPNASDYVKEEFDDIAYNDKATGQFISEVTWTGNSGWDDAATKNDVDMSHPAIEHLENTMNTLQDGEFNTRPGTLIARLVFEYNDEYIDKCLGAELLEEFNNY